MKPEAPAKFGFAGASGFNRYDTAARQKSQDAELHRSEVVRFAVVVDRDFFAGVNVFDGGENFRALREVVVSGVWRVRMVVDRTAAHREGDGALPPFEAVLIQLRESVFGFEVGFWKDPRKALSLLNAP